MHINHVDDDVIDFLLLRNPNMKRW